MSDCLLCPFEDRKREEGKSLTEWLLSPQSIQKNMVGLPTTEILCPHNISTDRITLL